MHYSNRYTYGFIKTAALSLEKLIAVLLPWTLLQREQYAEERDKKYALSDILELELALLLQQLSEIKKGKNPELRDKLLLLFSTPWPLALFLLDLDLQLRKRLSDDLASDIAWKLTQKGIPQWAIQDYMSYAPEYRKQYAEALLEAMQLRIKGTKDRMGKLDKH